MAIVEYLSDMSKGAGWDSVSGTKKGTAVRYGGDVSPLFENGLGQKVTSTLKRVESYSDLHKKMGVNVAMKVRGMLGFSAGAKMNFAKDSSYSSNSVNLLLTSRVINPPTMLNPNEVSLHPEMVSMAQEHPSEFFDRFGTEFISGVITGGEFFVLIQIHTSSQEEKSNLEAGMSFSTTVVEGSAGYADYLKSRIGTRNVNIQMVRSGGYTENFADIDKALEEWKKFPLVVKDKPVAIRAITSAYSHLRDYPTSLEPVEYANRDNVLERLSNYFYDYEAKLKDLEYISSRKEEFKEYLEDKDNPDEHLNSIKKIIDENMQEIVSRVRTCRQSSIAEDSKNCTTNGIAIPNTAVQIPERPGERDERKNLFMVYARDNNWTNTNVRVKIGQPITFEVIDGEWIVDKELGYTNGVGHDHISTGEVGDKTYLLNPHARFGALIAGIQGDDGKVDMVEISNKREMYYPSRSGVLKLHCNDFPWRPHNWNDNDGQLKVRVTVNAKLSDKDIVASSFLDESQLQEFEGATALA